MKTIDFDYNLPTELIAQKSVEPRDHSRLMLVDKKNKKIEHKKFFDIVDYFNKGDLVVWNNSKVFKARLLGKLVSDNNEELRDHKKPMEIFLVRPMENYGVWQALAKPGKHARPGTKIHFASGFDAEVVVKKRDGTILIQFDYDADKVRELANRHGHIPIPPYVKDEPHELEMYQTSYASLDKEGSVAAPTAGFHFTPELIEKLKAKGVEFAEVTLHVGLGTFLPVKSERIEDHTMHSEWVELSSETAEKINKAKSEGRRVVAVGTTTVRTLEGIAKFSLPLRGGAGGGPDSDRPPFVPPDRGEVVRPYVGDINLFITPGFEFRVIDAMITNFHLPKSTLLMLVAAFVGDREFTLDFYNKAVEERYRFFSFGDGMFIY